MIDTDKYEGHTDGSGWIWEAFWGKELVKFGKTDRQLIADAPKLLVEIKRLQKENKILAKYMDIVNKYDDALLADGDTDPRWSELYD
jgi:hypothetical protein